MRVALALIDIRERRKIDDDVRFQLVQHTVSLAGIAHIRTNRGAIGARKLEHLETGGAQVRDDILSQHSPSTGHDNPLHHVELLREQEPIHVILNGEMQVAVIDEPVVQQPQSVALDQVTCEIPFEQAVDVAAVVHAYR